MSISSKFRELSLTPQVCLIVISSLVVQYSVLSSPARVSSVYGFRLYTRSRRAHIVIERGFLHFRVYFISLHSSMLISSVEVNLLPHMRLVATHMRLITATCCMRTVNNKPRGPSYAVINLIWRATARCVFGRAMHTMHVLSPPCIVCSEPIQPPRLGKVLLPAFAFVVHAGEHGLR